MVRMRQESLRIILMFIKMIKASDIFDNKSSLVLDNLDVADVSGLLDKHDEYTLKVYRTFLKLAAPLALPLCTLLIKV